ncbi:MAG: DNA gyrase subunit A [Bdellovibrionota bacterium]|nr:MAG: DNA gyrase subunit A [Bdellovibrionota bacterium]
MTEAQISQVNIEDEMRQSYLDYAMSVIVGRALPDVRDGLKPVQRRVLYAMLREGLVSDRKHSKCAGVVGEVLKKFHPHGDSSVYEALVRLAQPWNLRYPLVDGQGNFGSIDGDPPAAYRYTECRMTKVAEKLLEDIDSETVDFLPNFDDSTQEPTVLPSVLPNLLINGADGIAVGMATHIPPHNLREVINATIAMIEDPGLSISALMDIMPGPDFPTGGVIYGKAGLAASYQSGRGVIQLRAKTHLENLKGKSREVEAIIVTEIPYQVNKARLIERIAELMNDKQIDGIARIRDESDRSGMRIVLELKRDATSDVVLNQLFKMTPLQSSFGIINLAIVDGTPRVCPTGELLKHFINHRRDVVIRRTQFELRRAQERMHLLEGFRIALLNIDEVITLIKAADTPKEAKDGLCQRFELSALQSQAILDLRLQKLTGMERLAVEKEHQELAKELERLRSLLADNKKIDAVIASELAAIRDQFGDDRRTEIVEAGADIEVEDLIEDEEMVVTISHLGYAKRTPVSVYRAQRRGGKGVTGAASKEEDFVEHLFVASTLAYLLVFTSLGRVYWLKVYEIPESARTARGRALVNLLDLRPDESVAAILPVREFAENRYVVMGTSSGIIKKVDLMSFSNPRRGGVIACSLDDSDRLIGVRLSTGSDDVLLATKLGMSIRFTEDDVRAMGRAARGVMGIRLDQGDAVVGMTVIAKAGQEKLQGYKRVDESGTLLTVCEHGYGKRSKLEDYRVQTRAGKGVIDIRTTDRNGNVVGVAAVAHDSGLMLITSAGKVIRILAKDISVIGRNTQGVKLIELDPEEKVSAIAPLMEREDEDTPSDLVQ